MAKNLCAKIRAMQDACDLPGETPPGSEALRKALAATLLNGSTPDAAGVEIESTPAGPAAPLAAAPSRAPVPSQIAS